LKKYENSLMKAEIETRIASGNVDLIICDFLTPAVNMPESSVCPTVLFQHNVESLIWKRHYQVQSNPLKKAYLFDQYRKIRSFESEACRRFNQVIAVSQTDAEIMRREFDITTVDDVPTGVDTLYYKPDESIPRRPSNLVFTGSMDWLPNEDAIRWFTDAVLPLIRKSKPDLTVTVVGRNPSPALVELGKRDAAVEVTGRVDDVRPYMDRAAAYIVPIRIGGGTRLKIYEAMAMEQPIISTTVGAEGLPLVDGKHLLLADTAESFAAAVTRVLEDPGLARQLGASAASLVRERFGWKGVTDRFVEISMMAFESFAEDERLVEGRFKAEAVHNGV
jgi:glycosyltransferase involved in cell wall biosynthesis